MMMNHITLETIYNHRQLKGSNAINGFKLIIKLIGAWKVFKVLRKYHYSYEVLSSYISTIEQWYVEKEIECDDTNYLEICLSSCVSVCEIKMVRERRDRFSTLS